MTTDELAARGIRVKPLSGDGDYIVAKTFGVWRAWYLADPLRDGNGRPIAFESAEAAKAAAEADHASRIAAQLECTRDACEGPGVTG